MEIEGFVYETLEPLSATITSASTATSTDPSEPTLSEPYSVFRNQISLSSPNCPSPEVAAPDYFSLDVDIDDHVEDRRRFPTCSSPAPGPTPSREADRRLELGWFRENSRFKSPMLQLHKEILDFCSFLSPTPEEQASRNMAVEFVFGVIKYIWPHCKVEVFGSFKTGLYLPTSDIDVVILDSKVRTPQIGLQALSRALSQRGIAKKIQVIAKARVPIIKFVEKRSGVAFDISFDVQNGPKAAEFITDAVAKLPPLRPLCLILKVFLQQRELNEVYSGGIGSYALLAMLIAQLKGLQECGANVEHNLGVLLVNFFDFYGRKLNTWDVGVSCRRASSFFLKSNKGFLNEGRPYLISIEDPQAPESDIGKNSFNYFQIRSAFAMAFSTLTNAKTIIGLGPNRSILGTIIRPDPVLLERKGGCNGDETFDSLLPGAGEPVHLAFEHQQGLMFNWQLDDEEPLPRGNDIAGAESADSIHAPKRKKASRDVIKENGELRKIKNEENGTRKGRHLKKKSRI